MMQTEIGTDVKKAKKILDRSEILAIPTETVYGLAGNGFDTEAIAKIYKAKQRPLSNPLILHYKNTDSAFQDTQEVTKEAKVLAERFWPGPLTMLLPKKDHIPNAVTAGKKNVAVRVPNEPLCQSLLHLLNYPIAAPSANLYGRISPTSSAHVVEQLNNRIPYVLDGGRCKKGIESTIVGFEKGNVIIYRLGAIDIESIEDCIGKKAFLFQGMHSKNEPITSGMVKHHYAPNTPMYALEAKNQFKNILNSGYIGFDTLDPSFPNESQFLLSIEGNMEEAAQNLYQAFHIMDEKKFNALFISLLPEKRIGRSINDRIIRAIRKNTP